MRITDRGSSDLRLADLQLAQQRLQQLQEQVTSGKQFDIPSQAPLDAVAAMQLQGSLDQNQQYTRNLDQAKSLLDAGDSALGSADTAVQRLRELAVQGNTATLSPSDRAAVAAEVDQLVGQLVDLGNTKFGDRYLFGGFHTQAAPFAAVTDASGKTTSVNYLGDHGATTVQASATGTITTNLPGDQVFAGLIQSAIGLRDHLQSGTSVSSDLTAIDNGLNNLLTQRAVLGARSNAVQMLTQQTSADNATLQALLSNRQDVDLPSAISRLTQQQTAYQVALQAGARLMSPTLLDYLR